MPIIPLFPLSTVLFPGLALPLHIFEERYKTMLRLCLAGEGTFGIVLIREGWEVGPPAVPYDVGTLARIVRVEELADGRMNVVVVGEHRFRIRSLVEGQPFLQGRVETLADEPSQDPPGQADRVRQQLLEYVAALGQISQRPAPTIALPESALELSYAVAASLSIPAAERQVLLEESLVRRLDHESRILQREMALLPRIGAAATRRAVPPPELPRN